MAVSDSCSCGSQHSDAMSSPARTTKETEDSKGSGISPSLRIGSFCLNDFRQDSEPHREGAAELLLEMLRRFDLLLLMEARAENSPTNIDLLIQRLEMLDKNEQFDFEEDEAICPVHGREHYCFFYRVSRLTVLDTMYPTENEVLEKWEEKQLRSREEKAFSLHESSKSEEEKSVASTMREKQMSSYENEARHKTPRGEEETEKRTPSDEKVTRMPYEEGQTARSASASPVKMESLVIESLLSTSSSHETDVFSLTTLHLAISQNEDSENTPDIVKDVKYGAQRAHSLAKSIFEFIPKSSKEEQKTSDTGKNEGEDENEDENEGENEGENENEAEDENFEEDDDVNQSMNLETQKSSSDSEDNQKGVEGDNEDTIQCLHDALSEEMKIPYGSKCSRGLVCDVSSHASTIADSSLEGRGMHVSLPQDSPAIDQLQADEPFSTNVTTSSVRDVREVKKETLPMVVVFKGEPAPRMMDEPRFNVMEILESMEMANTPTSSTLSSFSALPITVDFLRREGNHISHQFTDSAQRQSTTLAGKTNVTPAGENEASNAVASGSIVFDQDQAVHKCVRMAFQSSDGAQEQGASSLESSNHSRFISENNVELEKAAPVGEFVEGREAVGQISAGEPPTSGKERTSDVMEVQKTLMTPEFVSSARGDKSPSLSPTDEVASLYGTGDVESFSESNDVMSRDQAGEVVSLPRDGKVAGPANVQTASDPSPGGSMAPDQEEAAQSSLGDASQEGRGLGGGGRRPVNNARRREDREKIPPIVFLGEPFVVRFRAPSSAVSEFIAVALHTNPSEVYVESLRIQQLYYSINDKWHIPDVLFMGDLYVQKMAHLDPGCWKLLEQNTERLFVKMVQMLSNTRTNSTGRNNERMLLTGDALIRSFCKGSDAIFWYDEELGLSQEVYLEIMSNRFPMQIKLWGAVLPPRISGVKVHTSLKVEQTTLVTSKTHIERFHRANGQVITGFHVTLLMGGGLKLVRATKNNVTDVRRCLNDFQLVFPNILQSSTISTISSLMATSIMSSQLSSVYRNHSTGREDNKSLYIVSVMLSLKEPHICYVIVTQEVN